QQRERAATGDAADDLLVAAVFAGRLAQDLGREPLRFRVAGVHAVEIAGEDRGLVAAGAGAHLEEDVLVVARILRQQQAAQLLLLAAARALEARDLLLTARARDRVCNTRRLACRSQLAVQLIVTQQPL